MTKTVSSEPSDLSPEQQHALALLHSGENIFLTGGAGSGKSYVIREFFRKEDPQKVPILASTGAAAVLLGGRTFHSFFGLGLMEGGPEATLEKTAKDARLRKRLRQVEGVVIDEVSMIPGQAWNTANLIAQRARESQLPWGGLRIIAVGDFLQLPPIGKERQRDWCFLTPAWKETAFQNCVLNGNQRVSEPGFLEVLNQIRFGTVSNQVKNFLDSYVREHDEEASGTRLFPRRDQVEYFNNKKLNELTTPEFKLEAIYFGESKYVEILKKSAPVREQLILRPGCEVLFVQNDPQKRWVNGTRGYVTEIKDEKVLVHKDKGRTVTVDRSLFAHQDADGNILASVLQFPLVLGYATTIHKSQGATLDEIWCDLGSLWEPGQAYVALSRLRSARGLNLLRWNSSSIRLDPQVVQFYKNLSGDI